MEKSREVDPASAAQLEQVFASNDIMAVIEKGIKPLGLSVNECCDAYTVWWINAWEGSRGHVDVTPKARVIAVKNQAVLALLTTPAFRGATDAQKQKLAESYFVQAALIEGAIDGAKSDPQLLTKVQNSIKARRAGIWNESGCHDTYRYWLCACNQVTPANRKLGVWISGRPT